MEKFRFKTVDDYFDAQTEEALVTLLRLRKSILKFIPNAEECIYYQMPAVRYKGKAVVAYAAFKKHCSFYIMSMKTANELKPILKNVDIKGVTIQFGFNKTIPQTVLKPIIKARMQETDLFLEKTKKK